MKKEDIQEMENPTERSKFFASCPRCKKIVVGSTKDQVLYNMGTHIGSKLCKSREFEMRVQDPLPPRTPGYVSPKSKTTSEVQE